MTATQALGYLIAFVINLALIAGFVAATHTEPAPITKGCTPQSALPTRSN